MKMQARAIFYQHVRNALGHYYDSEYLRNCALADDLSLAGQFGTPSTLQKILADAIESLKPPVGESLISPKRQIYDILSYHYLQRFKQDLVARHLGVSERHMRRLQTEALDVLTSYLWEKWDLKAQPRPVMGQARDGAGVDNLAHTKQEWSWLKDAPPPRIANVLHQIQDVLVLAQPMATQRGLTIQLISASSIPDLLIHPVSLRQILLSLLGVAIQRSSAGQVRLELAVRPGFVDARIEGRPNGEKLAAAMTNQQNQLLAIAEYLTSFSGGCLAVADSGDVFDVTLSLPTTDDITVLVIDDNEDIIRLLERYAEGSHYIINGANRPVEAIEAAIASRAQIIVLDVMMPSIDGWEMLGRLRRHPSTADVPVVILTVLAQEELALSLGAQAFVLKPVSQQDFLAALDRVSVEQKITPG
jgi:CheY-like chemotaxis protein